MPASANVIHRVVHQTTRSRMHPRIIIRPPSEEDRDAVVAAANRSRALHQDWVFAPTTPKKFEDYLKRISQPSHCGFVVVNRATGALVGIINLGHIIREPLHSAFVAYYAFAEAAGRGLMSEGMAAVLRHAFTRLKLHRVEANIQPGNERSLRFIRRCGFVREGFSPRYLKIAGRWRDHERWALLAEDWRSSCRAKQHQH